MQLFRRQPKEKKEKGDVVKQIKTPANKWRLVAWGLVIIITGIAGWIATTGYLALKNISTTNDSDGPSDVKLSGALTPADVKIEGDSRINILLAGIGGSGHSGPNLSDTLQVMSIDPVNKSVAVVSIPRDLYVTQVTGERSKINAVNADGDGYCKIKGCATGVDHGGAAMKDIVQKVLGIHIDYFARINFNGFKQLVDTVGGVDVQVETTLSDPLYPCPDPSTDYCPIYITAGLKHFDGTTALKYARSRETTSDFDRSKRQQQILSAVKKKATTAGILANPQKVTQLINVLGANFKTDMQTSDLFKVIDIVKSVDMSAASVYVLDTATGSPLKSVSDPQAGYIIMPDKGMNDYSDVHLLVASYLPDPYIQKEKATVAVINATGKSNQDVALKAILKAYGYNVISFTDASIAQTSSTITNSESSPFTVSLLKQRFKASVSKTSSTTADVSLTIGSNYLK